jgi:quercetin dioxygenase-like cupin family protein
MEQHKTICHYPKDKLVLRQDVPGAKMWAVALEQSMLTYFEVEPNSRFDLHKHKSEQITLVLEGILYFETQERTVAVRAGEVIAVPSSMEHAVYTKNDAVRAVDAWSPIREDYKNR